MEIKELKITPPEGYCIDETNSTFDCIKFKLKSLTYEDIAKELFRDKCYSIDAYDHILCTHDIILPARIRSCNATSRKQLQKLRAINKLMNVAKYLNGDWNPDSTPEIQRKFYIYIDTVDNKNEIKIGFGWNWKSTDILFKTSKCAQQAIDILGEDTIRLACSTDW